MNAELARQRLHLVMLRNETSLDISGFRCVFISNEVKDLTIFLDVHFGATAL